MLTAMLGSGCSNLVTSSDPLLIRTCRPSWEKMRAVSLPLSQNR